MVPPELSTAKVPVKPVTEKPKALVVSTVTGPLVSKTAPVPAKNLTASKPKTIRSPIVSVAPVRPLTMVFVKLNPPAIRTSPPMASVTSPETLASGAVAPVATLSISETTSLALSASFGSVSCEVTSSSVPLDSVAVTLSTFTRPSASTAPLAMTH